MGKELIKLSASLRVPRMAKDGEKGVGVVSANVLFAVGTDKNDSSDIKDADWKDTFGKLALVKGKFVWSCTKTTYTKGNPSYTGKYCLGECYDFAEVTEMYALSDNGTNEPADGDKVWGESYVATKGKYLWTCERVVYTQNGVPSYLNKKCITYFAKDGVNGTSFTPIGTAVAHYEKSSLIPSGYKAGEVYLVDANDTSLPKVDAPCVVTITKVGSAGALALANKKADTGDAYRIGTNLWVSNGTKWVDFGDIQGPKGDDGEDALRVECNPKQLVFSVNENGQIIDINGAVFDNSKRSVFSLKVYKGKTNVTNDATFSLSTPSGCNFTNTNDGAWLSYQKFNGFVWVYVSPNGIDRISYKVGDANKDLPKTSSYVRATINYNGETTNVDVPLFVEFAAYNGDLEHDIYGLNSHYESLSNKVKDQGVEIEENKSQIKQTAESINMTVSSAITDNNNNIAKTYSTFAQTSDAIAASVKNMTEGLEDTGIYISDRKIKFVSDNFGIYNNNGELTMSVDADGNLVTSGSAKIKGTIEANAGKFGPLEIISRTDTYGFSYYSISAYSAGSAIYSPSQLYIDYTGISLIKGYVVGGDSPIQATAEIGGRELRDLEGEFYWDDGFIYVDTESTKNAKHAVCAYGAYSIQQNSDYDAIGYKAYVEGGKNNYAFQAVQGDFKADGGSFIGGFCDKILHVTDSTINNTSIGNNVSAIICKNTSKEITLNLPKSPKLGMTFKVFQATKLKVSFNGNGHNIVAKGQDYPDGMSTWYTGTRNQMSIFIFDGDMWYVAFMNG